YLHHSEGAQLVALVQRHRIEPDTHGMAGWLRQIGWAKLDLPPGWTISTSPATSPLQRKNGRTACSRGGRRAGPIPLSSRRQIGGREAKPRFVFGFRARWSAAGCEALPAVSGAEDSARNPPPSPKKVPEHSPPLTAGKSRRHVFSLAL